MPLRFDEIESAARLGGLDTTSLVDGGMPANAHHLRSVARNANRVLQKYDTVFGYCWDAREDLGDGEGSVDIASMSLPAQPEWKTLYPGAVRCPKLPGHNRINVHLTLDTRYLSGGKIHFCAADMRMSASPPLSTETKIVTADDEGQSAYSVTGVVVAEGPHLELNFWIRGDPGEQRSVHIIDGYDGDNQIYVTDDVAFPYDRVPQGHAVRIAAFLEFFSTFRSTWGPWALVNVARTADLPVDSGDGFRATVDAPGGIPEIAKRQGYFMVLHKMPRFKPFSIVVESWRSNP